MFAGTRTSFVSWTLIGQRHGRTSPYARITRVMAPPRLSPFHSYALIVIRPTDIRTASSRQPRRPYRWMIIMHEFREPVVPCLLTPWRLYNRESLRGARALRVSTPKSNIRADCLSGPIISAELSKIYIYVYIYGVFN